MLREGQIFDGTYRLLRRVGEGGMGVVYEATHARLAGRYAIKVLTQELAESPEANAYFDREARITSLLQHPNIVQVIDHDRALDGTEYIVMEYLPGESLSQRLSRLGRLPLDAVVEIVEQIAAGLAAAHARGIVHRDLKPDNVLLVPVEGRRSEVCKLLDFGVSVRRGSPDSPDLVCGTPQYMAPEQIEGRLADVDGSTDQFALAVMTEEMLTGRNPFAAETLEATFVRIAAEPPRTLGLGAELDAVLARALAKSQRQRFPSVTDFAEALRLAAKSSSQRPRLGADAPPPTGSEDVERKRALRGPTARLAVGAIVTFTVLMAASTMATTLRSFRQRPRLVPAAAPSERPSTPGRLSAIPAPAAERPPATAATVPARRPADDLSIVRRVRSPQRKEAPRARPAARVRVSTLPPDEDATMPLSEVFDSR